MSSLPTATAILVFTVIMTLFHRVYPQTFQVLTPPVVELPRPYNFGYEFGDGVGITQYRHEAADGTGSVKGSYGYTDPLGQYRKVEYLAGVDGFKAFVSSNEAGLSNQAVGDAFYVVEPPPPTVVVQGLRKASPLK